ncbi:MAG: leucine-rich repeat domain-containing protein [Lachnospiraceae bacterium]|nr:leucine-rich repeat domain-containing protein [Lachnospiraceae bacterium]
METGVFGKKMKRPAAVLTAMLMVFSMMPVYVFANEADTETAVGEAFFEAQEKTAEEAVFVAPDAATEEAVFEEPETAVEVAVFDTPEETPAEVIPDMPEEASEEAFFETPDAAENDTEDELQEIYGEYVPYEGATYVLEYMEKPDGTLEILNAGGDLSGELVIPERINRKAVTAIAEYAFYENSEFTGDLIIPDSVVTIGDYAFVDCTGFDGSLTIGSGVTTIGKEAFYKCGGFTGDLILPDSVITVKDYAFYQCGGLDGSLTIGSGVGYFGTQVFGDCDFHRIENKSDTEYRLPGVGWFDENTGEEVTSIANGTAVLQDLDECSWKPSQDATYELKYCLHKDNTVEITDIDGEDSGNLVIPDKIDEKPVTAIGDCAFLYCDGFTGDLVIPDSVTSIGDYAFYDCEGFTGSLTIGGNVTYIGDYAFCDCDGFTGDLIIPDSVTTICDYAFYGCTGFNGSLTIGGGVTAIGKAAFYYNSGFTGDLSIPDNITAIGDHAFYYCEGFTGDLTIGNGVETIGDYAFYYCDGFAGNLTLGDNVKVIGSYAFSECTSFTGDLTIGDNVTEIGESAFEFCSGLTGDLTIGDSVTVIGEKAFYYCQSLDGNLTIGGNVTTIGEAAFAGCDSLTGDLEIPDSVITIGEEAFEGCTGFDGRLIIGDSVTAIENGTFLSCSRLKGDLEIPNGVIKIGVEAFKGCSGLTGVLTIPDTVTEIRAIPFENSGFVRIVNNSNTECQLFGTGWINEITEQEIAAIKNGTAVKADSLKSWTPDGTAYSIKYYINGDDTVGIIGYTGPDDGNMFIPDKIDGKTVSSIGDLAFVNCDGFTGDLIIPEGVRTIGKGAFKGCSNLLGGTLTIPASVRKIGSLAFEGCNFKKIISNTDTELPLSGAGWKIEGTQTEITSIANGTAVRSYAGFDSVSPYTDASYTLNYYLHGDDTVEITGIDGDAEGDLVIPETIEEKPVTTIGAGAFKGCSGLTGDLKIPDSVTRIGDSAFQNCQELTGNIVIPAGVTIIGNDVFSGCSGFEGTLTIPEGVTKIGDCAFNNCYNLTGDLTIPAGVKKIGERAFNNCSGFDGILTIPEGIATIPEGAFSGCSGFGGSLTIPYGVVFIGDKAFENCSGFDGTLTIPYSVEDLGKGVFDECGFRVIANNSYEDVILPCSDRHTWTNLETGDLIDDDVPVISGGTAVRDFDTRFTYTEPGSKTFTGEKIEPVKDVRFGGRRLTEKSDYTITYKDNINVGTATFTIAGKGNYSGKETDTFKIIPRSIAGDEVIKDGISSVVFSSKKGWKYEPVPVLTYNGRKLAKNKNFTVTYHEYDNGRPYGGAVTPDKEGHFCAKVAGINNFTGVAVIPFDIYAEDKIPVSSFNVSKIPDQLYTGKAIEPDITVKKGSATLRKDTDYELIYGNNIETGTAYVTLTGKGDTYVGTRTLNFNIVSVSLQKASIGGFKSSVQYSGQPIEQNITLGNTFNGKKRNLNIIPKQAYEGLDPVEDAEERLNYDCMVEYADNVEIGTATMTLTGINGFTDQVIKTFKITGTAISGAKIDGFEKSFDYDGTAKIQDALRLTYKSQLLEKDRDYTVTYQNNTEIGTATMIITGMGAYYGTVKKTFKIEGGTPISKAVIEGFVPAFEYKGEAIEQEGMTLKLSGNELTEGEDYTVAYDNKNLNVGTAAVIITGKGSYYGSVKKTFKITAYDLSTDNGNIEVVLDASYPYAKSGVKPEPVVTFKGVPLAKGTDYTLSYLNNTAVKAKDADKSPAVKITGKGNFTKFLTKTFGIEQRNISGLVLKTGNVIYKAADGNWKTTVSVEEPDGKKLKVNKDYSITFTSDEDGNDIIDNKARMEAGKTVYITVTALEISSYTGQLKGSYSIYKYDMNKLTATIDPKLYTGKPVTITAEDIRWKSGNTDVTADVGFEIDESSYKNNTNKGTASVIVNGTGNTAGSKKLTYTIGTRDLLWWWNGLPD